jgi:ATP-dependent Lon protease
VKKLKMPDGSTTTILQGREKILLKETLSEEPYISASFEILDEEFPVDDKEFLALIQSVRELSKRIVEISPHIPTEAMLMLQNIRNDRFLLNFIASNLNISVDEKQSILELKNAKEKAEEILHQLDSELQILEIKDQIESKVRGDIEKQQRDYFLNQQLKTIQEELGQSPQAEVLAKLSERAKAMKWPKEAKKRFDTEMDKLKRMNPQVAEYGVHLTYVEFLLDLPWEKMSKDNFDLNKVQDILDKDHYGLKEVKGRILEHLAVLKLKGDMKAPIICLVGPPGVGKTSLGKSIARALNRQFVRMSLGGLHDESEIRGHRKTYIGAMPGRILQSIKKAGAANPVFILDEIDKMGKDFRGDPSSALLEVLDPEQNISFQDNYLEMEYDLSKVLFIATANSLSSLQPALLDRMEIIEISGYSTEEKIMIAKRHLIPEQRKNHGVKGKDVQLPENTIEAIIQGYTRESGVRSLNRQIAGVMRYVAKHVAMEQDYNKRIKPDILKTILGPEKVSKDQYSAVKTPGVAVGLAWTRVGGDILFIESSVSKGKGKLTLTGNLGDVMKESATTALSFIKAHAKQLGIEEEVFDHSDLHIHVPEGAIPKDGPSAGITMLTALCSVLKGIPVKPYLAMTGEITLRGKVLPVGGIKEKLLAAKRAGMKEVMLCAENAKHVEEIDQEFLKGLDISYIESMDEVLVHALGIKI